MHSSFGFLTVLVGTLLHLYRNKWLGLSLLATGFSEMIYWTYPSWRGGAELEYDRLLFNKMVFSFLATIALLVVAWLLKLIKDEKKENENSL